MGNEETTAITIGLHEVAGLRWPKQVAPVVILLFVVADVLLLWGRLGDLRPPGWIFAALGVAGVLLILTGLIPDAMARATGAPYVARDTCASRRRIRTWWPSWSS